MIDMNKNSSAEISETNNKLQYSLSLKFMIVKELGLIINNNSRILDFGCGSGGSVQEFRKMGYQAFGCDIDFMSEKNVDTEVLIKENLIRQIETNPYHLPFEINTFDFIYSHSF